MPKNDDSAHPIVVSWMNKVELGESAFQHSLVVNASLDNTKRLAQYVLAKFDEDVKIIRPINHATWSDGSESDLWAQCIKGRSDTLLLEISRKWIDTHFLRFTAWTPSEANYTIDPMFEEELVNEGFKKNTRTAEIIIAPCTLKISTVNYSPETYLPKRPVWEKYLGEALKEPAVRFWSAYKEARYGIAVSCLEEVQSNWSSKDSQYLFLGAVKALCYFLDKQNGISVDQFLSTATGFNDAGFPRTCDVCLFFALEAVKGMDNLNQANAALEKTVQRIPNLSNTQKQELQGIVKNYIMSVYIGVVVLCRRVIELTLTEILTERFGLSIDALIKKCREDGVLTGNVKRGLYAVLVVAKWKEIITLSEYKVAICIKDFGDRIHSKGGVENSMDAKYAIQACIHILRSVGTKTNPI